MLGIKYLIVMGGMMFTGKAELASRMEQMSEPGTTYCSEDTFTLTEGMFRFECLGEKEIKGK